MSTWYLTTIFFLYNFSKNSPEKVKISLKKTQKIEKNGQLKGQKDRVTYINLG